MRLRLWPGMKMSFVGSNVKVVEVERGDYFGGGRGSGSAGSVGTVYVV